MPQLLSQHKQNLKESTLTNETIEKYGFYSVSKEEAEKILDTETNSGGYVIKYPDSHYLKIRLDKKKGKARYLGPKGMSYDLFITNTAKDNDKDKNCSFFFTEGEKKALALEQLGYAAISLSGVWGFKSKGHEVEKLLYLNLRDRICYIVFDADKTTKPQVRKAEKALAQNLNSLGAIIKIINLDKALGKGIDDQIKSFKDNGNLSDFKTHYIDTAVNYKDYITQSKDDSDSESLTPAKFAAEICKKHFIIYCAENFYTYQNGFYHNINEEEIQQLIVNINNKNIRMSKIKEIIFFMKSHAFMKTDRLNSTEYLNLKNGLFDLENSKLLSHTPNIYSTIQLQVDYNPKAECVLWLKTLNEIFENDAEKINTLQEFFGLCFTKETKYEKALFCLGEGANGKSVILNTLGTLIGKDNYSAIPLEQFSNLHYLANLFGRLVNISIETNANSTVYDSIFKAIVSGDPIEADQKFKKPITFKPFCKLIFAVNGLPTVTDKTIAFFRRLLILKFNKEFEETAQDKNLKTKLLKELDGIFIWSLEGLKRLKERDYFIITEVMQEEITNYRRENNPVILYINEKCSVDNPNAYESKEFLYNDYKTFCKNSGYHELGNIKFNREVKRQFKMITESRSGEEKGWQGVKVLILGRDVKAKDLPKTEESDIIFNEK
ncbi:MAG: phage/plasmid primase, P4 family [Candidatus Omnitrophota bacterium]|jgi:putative DNA primase/helicase